MIAVRVSEGWARVLPIGGCLASPPPGPAQRIVAKGRQPVGSAQADATDQHMVVHRHTHRYLLLCSMSRYSLGRYTDA
jgi:hypothetical protein